MKKNNPVTPPRWAQRFLEWYCRPELLEDLQGDLNEYFERHCKNKGQLRAKLIYALDVLKFFRNYTVRKPEFVNLLIHWFMLNSYIKTSGRSIIRNKLFSTINIAGLAVSMSVGLLLIAMTSDLLSYDRFHDNRERIYRVNTCDSRNDGPPMNLASTSVIAGKKISETISGVEYITFIRRGFAGDAITGENTVPVSGLWADQSFFNVFTFPLLQGNPAIALKEPYSIVLTEQSAKKIFGHTDVLGQTLKFDSANYTVTGIMKEIPKLSHIRFESLVSFSTVELAKPDTDGDFLSWENIFMTYIYLIPDENGDPEAIQAKLDRLSTAENSRIENHKITLWLQPLHDIPLNGNLTNPIGPAFDKMVLWIFGGLALVVILSACFNYTNLSIARSFRRSREIGIRKVIGARKSHVLLQFIAESVIIALLALSVSFVLFLFLRTQLLSLHSFLGERFLLELSPGVIFWFIALAIAVGIAAGFLPAFYFSRINGIQALKNSSNSKVFRHVSIRKTLIVVQYTFSLIFIATTIIGYSQYRGFIKFDLGFTTANIVNIRINGTNGDALVKELSELPEVQGISRSIMVTSIGNIYGNQMKYKNDSSGVLLNLVDEHYLPLHQHQFMAGRNFHPKQENAEEHEVIVNEQLLRRFNIGEHNPDKALGEAIIMDDKKLIITGVIKDFHYGTLAEKITPMLFRHSEIKTYGFINVKIQTKDWPATFTSIQQVWRKIDKVHPLNAKFYDDQIEEAYSEFSVMIKVIGFLAFLAICISSMGLLGMVVFTTETRLKEISIRKVLGASESKLIFLLSQGFLLLLTISALVALPATYLFFDFVVLMNFAYHQPIGLTDLFISLVIVMALAFLMIGSQTLKAARTNPAEVLKNE
jgi:ABC-type antimicrobial peptide transport system permease subunit